MNGGPASAGSKLWRERARRRSLPRACTGACADGHGGLSCDGSPTHYGDLPIEPRDFALNLADVIARQQGQDIVILDVSGPLAIADYFVIATTRNSRHAHALAREILTAAKAEGQRHNRVSGLEDEGGWVLVDLDWIVVHLFLADKRAFYDLESLWSDAPRIPFTPSEPPARAPEPAFDPLRGTV